MNIPPIPQIPGVPRDLIRIVNERLRLLNTGVSTAQQAARDAQDAIPATPVSTTPPRNPTLLSLVPLKDYMEGGKQYRQFGLQGSAPSPLGTFAGVHLYEECPDGSNPADARKVAGVFVAGDTAHGPFSPIDLGKFRYSASDEYLAVFSVEVPSGSPTARIYAAPFSEAVDTTLVPANEASPTPSLTVVLSPYSSGSVGAEYCANVKDVSFVVRKVQVGGVVWAKLYLTYTRPTDPRFTGVRVMCYRHSDMELLSQGGQFNETSDKDVAGGVWPSPAETWLLRVFSYSDPAGVTPSWESALVNTYVEGVTPEVEVSVGDGTGSLDLAKATPETLTVAAFASGVKPIEVVSSLPTDFTNYPADTIVLLSTDKKLYKSTGAAWTAAAVSDPVLLAYAAIGIVAAGAISTDQLAANEVVIGSGTGKCPRFRVNDSLGNMIAFIGVDALGNKFNWFQNIRIGTDINNPTIYGSSSGVAINGATFTLNLNGVTTSIANVSVGGWSDIAGLSVLLNDSYTRAIVSPTGLVLVDPNNVQHGLETIYESGWKVALYCNIVSGVTFRTTGGDGLTTTVGYNKSGGGTGTLTFTAGILTGST